MICIGSMYLLILLTLCYNAVKKKILIDASNRTSNGVVTPQKHCCECSGLDL